MATRKSKAQNIAQQQEHAAGRFRQRIKELIWVKASELVKNSSNWKIHSSNQVSGITTSMNEIGIADAAIAYRDNEGRLVLADGHARKEILSDELMPVLVTDLNEEEARKLLAVLDPLAGLVEPDASKLAELVESINSSNQEFLILVNDLSQLEKEFQNVGDFEPVLNPDSKSSDVTKQDVDLTKDKLDNKFSIKQKLLDVICPNCAHEFKIDKP